jgi:hypothetical protein
MSELSLGLLAGALWNAANFWVLARLLRAWVGPRRSQRRVVGWLIVKLAAVYPAAFLALRHPLVSPLGFGLGFTLVLFAGIGWLMTRTQRALVPHGR